MLRIGITGGVGAGKSTIAKIFSNQYGIKVYNSSEQAKLLLNSNEELIAKIKDLLGSEVYLNKSLITNLVSSKIFSNDDLRLKMQNIVHKYVIEDFESKLKKYEDEKYVLFESAILIETGLYKNFDKIIVVNSNLETRLKRLMEHRHMSEEKALSIINSQVSDSERLKHASYLINNDLEVNLYPNIIDRNWYASYEHHEEIQNRKERTAQLKNRIEQIHNRILAL